MIDALIQPLSFEEFFAHYGNNPRYELADGELIDMEPTGPHEVVAGKVSSKLNVEIERQGQPWFIPCTCIIRPFTDIATARRPDVVVLDETTLVNEPLWEREPVITLGTSIKLIIEVVSTNWETEYARKVEEYVLLRIPEYWIVDYRGLGGVAFIGRSNQPTITICQLFHEDYLRQTYRLEQPIASQLLPELTFKLDDVLPR